MGGGDKYGARGDREAERGSKDGVVAPWVACAVAEAAEVCKRSWFILVDSTSDA